MLRPIHFSLVKNTHPRKITIKHIELKRNGVSILNTFFVSQVSELSKIIQ